MPFSGLFLTSALSAVQEAVRLEPRNALAWARLAELWLSTGYSDRALDAAGRAAGINPNVSRTQTILGYSYLIRFKIADAQAAFERAIALDQADPLPRLGLGLAKIREGELEEGRQEIEIAAALDPANSLVRSYLGKAYYEENTAKRDKLAATEYGIAKKLDPNDPTPWFYDAILKQTQNRPVEALDELERSIALNDNRAVYRSRLLLDEDRATRTISLARTYNNVGFTRLGLLAASESLDTSPDNSSAHRFLSDSYLQEPRHEIARVSELLQARLLQPISSVLISPCLSDTDALIARTSAPELANYEYTRMFEEDRPNLYVSGLVGDHGKDGVGASVYGTQSRLAYSIGGCR
jgi:Flp pilus assembly protein TadD